MLKPVVEVGVHAFRDHVTIPEFKTTHAAAADICAWTGGPDSSITLAPGERKIVNTGLNLIIPEGYEVQIRPRSGLAAKHGITIVNTPGTIDSDFDGSNEDFEIKVIILNTGNDLFVIKHGDRIAQMAVREVPYVSIKVLQSGDWQRKESNRSGGFGSTGR